MKYYINNFIVYSILGFIIETTMKYLFNPSMQNGTLYGPWVPIYGIGTCLIIIIERLVFNRFKVNKTIKIISVFLISIIILTGLEFITGNIVELLTDKVLWDYSKMKFNIGHYISLEIALVWGIASLVIIYIIKPITDNFIKKYQVLLLT